jgi:soluble lytic murein transglycosylase-like protein
MISRLFAAVLAAAAVLTFSAPAFAGPYDAIISKYASSYGVPVSLAKAVVQVESGNRPNIRGKAGEIGLMQVKLSTARGLGFKGSAKALYNPDTNIRYGMKYLAMAHKLGGKTTCGTILRYNAGHGAKRMNPTSARYCTKVKRVMGVSA